LKMRAHSLDPSVRDRDLQKHASRAFIHAGDEGRQIDKIDGTATLVGDSLCRWLSGRGRDRDDLTAVAGRTKAAAKMSRPRQRQRRVDFLGALPPP
jgi:hypothetical protein